MKNDWLGSNPRGLAIIRISSRRQEGNESHDVQENGVRQYCSERGIEVQEYVRIIESAKDHELRTKYAEAIKRAVDNGYRHVLFYMNDREARNLTDTERNEKYVRMGVLVLHYVRDLKIIHEDSPDGDFFMRDVSAVTSKHYSRVLTSRVNDAMRQKAERGWYPSNVAPLGYIVQRARDENGRELKRGSTIARDPDPKKIALITREFELRARGYSFEQIRVKIISEGLVAPERAHQYRASSIDQRIRNPFYSGRFIWQGVEYEGKHEIIIPPALVDAARSQRRSFRVIEYGSGAGLFGGGWLRCGECGCHIVYDPKKKTAFRTKAVTVFHYYHCANGKRMHASQKGMNIQEKEIWAQFDSAVESIQITESQALKISDALNRSHRDAIGASAQKISDTKATLKALIEREDRLYEDFIGGILDAESYRRHIAKIRGERARLTSDLEAAQSVMKGSHRENMTSILELAKNTKELYLSRSPLERREFLNRVLSNPRLTRRSIGYDLKSPFDEWVKMNRNG